MSPRRPKDSTAGDEEPTLSALEEALRRALREVPRAQVLARITTALPVEIDIGQGTRLRGGRSPQAAAESDVPHGKVQKVSVSMPADLAELVRDRTGAGGFSRYVTDAVQEQIRLDLLADLSAELEAEYGPLDEGEIAQAAREWPDYEEE